jgi:hypothetical protein
MVGMSIRIVPIAAEHIEAFHRALDLVARERKYLAFSRHRRWSKPAPSS